MDGSNQRQDVNRLLGSLVSQTLRLQRKLFPTTLHIATYTLGRSSGSTQMVILPRNAVLMRPASAYQQQHRWVGLTVNNRIEQSLEGQLHYL